MSLPPPPDEKSVRTLTDSALNPSPKAIGTAWPETLDDPPAGPPPTPGTLSNAALTPSAPPPEAAERYEMLGEIGRGGMGCVLRARDAELKRELAVKVLLSKHDGRPEVQQRFIEEAQIAGQLQHPGVAPVYDLGRFPDRRPYFTMKLVQGRTLAALLDERPAPSADLPRFLTVFEQIAQTMAYAHAQGVIHRDLKPQNVMVGAFGEVQVMDWGLAKVLRSGEPARVDQPSGAREGIQTGRTEEAWESRAGSILGTPAYMAPEQARGETDRIDERSDVFGLGAILCQILTGAPPYEGPAGSTLTRAARADLADARARLDGCGADPELIALAKECLAAEREQRPADAGALAARVTAYRAGVQERLRQAEVERAAAEARAQEAQARTRAERRARRLTLGLAASVVLTLALGGGGYAWLRNQQLQREADEANRRAEQAQRDAQATVEIEDSLRRARHAQEGQRWADAWVALERAEGRAADAGSEELRQQLRALRRQLEQGKKDQEMIAKLEEARLQSASVGRVGDWDLSGSDARFREAFAWYGLEAERLDPETAAERIRRSPITEPLLAALDAWAGVKSNQQSREKEHLGRVAMLADPDPWRRGLREAVRRKDWGEVQRRAGEADVLRQPPPTVILLAEVFRGSGAPGRALELLREVQRRHPEDFWLNCLLGDLNSEMKPPHPEDSVRYFTAALAIRPRSATVHYNLGIALYNQRKLPEAVAEYKEALRLRPDDARAHNNLGLALQAQGKLPEAVAEYREALRLRPDNPGTHTNLGSALQAQGKLPEALAEHREALRLQPDYPLAHANLGNALQAQGKFPEALAAFREALRLQPDNPGTHTNLGNALQAQQKLPEAEAEFREALRLQPDFPLIHFNLGNALKAQGKVAQAEAEYREALRLQPDYPDAHANLGLVLSNQQKLPEAVAAFQEALRLQPNSPQAHNNLGIALKAQNKLSEAVAEYREALRLQPDYPDAHYNLGNALEVQGKLPEAVAAFREALRLRPDFPEPHIALGFVLRNLGDFSDSLASMRRGHELGRKQPGWRYPSAEWVRQAERLVELDAQLPGFLSGQTKPKDAAEQIELAQLCQRKQLHAAAARFCADAFTAEPKRAEDLKSGSRYNAAYYAVLAGCKKGKDAAGLDDKERARLRTQARDWLRADLAAWAQLADSGKADERALVQRMMRLWKQDPDLAGVRDKDALDKLSEAERTEWRKLWGDVDDLLKKTQPKE
jgi:serine/threonine-protein kinase